MAVLSEENLPTQVLLHACCAPCSAAILEWLLARGVRAVLYFYNPNIWPELEYEKRKNELKRYASKLGVTYFDDDWNHELWRKCVLGLEDEPERGKRCLACFGMRLEAAAAKAESLGIEVFTTTLAGSRWKRQDQIEQAAQAAMFAHPSVRYWNQNWRRGGLQERRGVLLRENGFYNQQYCGCEFSMRHLNPKKPQDFPK